MPEVAFERIGSHEVWRGRIASVREDTFRYHDGGQADREIVEHPGAVSIVAFDGEAIWLVRQPREAVGEPELLELPAGKLDEEGEEPEQTARRELAEEIGKGARTWRHLTTFYTSPGILSEIHHLYLATDLYHERAESGEEERIQIERLAVADLDGAIAALRDSKTLIGLLWFKAYLQDG